jgi:hypothetical protein
MSCACAGELGVDSAQAHGIRKPPLSARMVPIGRSLFAGVPILSYPVAYPAMPATAAARSEVLKLAVNPGALEHGTGLRPQRIAFPITRVRDGKRSHNCAQL